MSNARITVDIYPSGKPGFVYLGVMSENNGDTLSPLEIVIALQKVVDGIKDGSITPKAKPPGP